MLRGLCALALLAAAAAREAGSPITEQVRTIQEGLEKQGDDDKKASDRLGCWCETYLKEKEQLLDDSQQELQQLGSDIEAQSAGNTRLNLELKEHREDLDTHSQQLDTVQALREKESDKFSEDEQSHASSISALDDAIAALHTSHGHELALTATQRMMKALQGSSGRVTAQFVQLRARLQSASSPDMIYGILKQMRESFSSNLESMQKEDKAAKEQHNDLVTAKAEEIAAIKKQLLLKKKRAADGEQQVAQKKKQKAGLDKLLDSNRELVAAMRPLCSGSEEAFQARTEARQAELVALSSAQAEIAGARFLAVSAHEVGRRDFPMPGSGAAKLCEAAIGIVEEEWRSRAKGACDKAKAGETQGAADAAESLKADIEEAQKSTQSKQSDCERSIQEAGDRAKEETASNDAKAAVIGSDRDGAESQIEALNAQAASCQKAKAELAEAHSALHSLMSEVRMAANHAKGLLQRAEAPVPAKAKLGEAVAASDKLAAACEAFDAKSSDDVQKVTGLLDASTRAVAKAVIPLKLIHADAEEAAVAVREDQESTMAMHAPKCEPSTFASKATKFGGYVKDLGDASEALAMESLR